MAGPTFCATAPLGPAELIARQAAGWDPLLDWAATALDAPLRVTQGVMHVAQDPQQPRTADRRGWRRLALFQLTAFHDLVAISGSLVLALAVIDGRLAGRGGLDPVADRRDWQTELWGA